MQRLRANIGQVGIFDDKAAGIDVPLEEDPDWHTYAATRHYSLADMREAFDAGLARGAKHGAFDDLIEKVLVEREKRNAKPVRQKKRRQQVESSSG